MEKLTSEELKRYSRHLVLKGFGVEGQLKLKEAKVLVVGAGGLGCPVLSYLTAAGVGQIGIADFDDVNISNLQRQVLFNAEDLGVNKATSAKKHLQKLNAQIQINCIVEKITSLNAIKLLKEYDLIIDCSDNFPTRYLLNDACVLLDLPLIYGSIHQYEGQMAIFNYRFSDGSFSSNYRDLFPEPPDPEMIPDCAEAGVLGVLPGIIGSIQANETIKILTQSKGLTANTLLIFDSQSNELTTIGIPNRGSRTSIKQLIDYEEFCNKSSSEANDITVHELKQLQESKADFVLIDIRQAYEYEAGNLGGIHIPMNEIPQNVSQITRDKKIIIHCRSGNDSRKMISWLSKNKGFTNLYNLQGGILAWKNEINQLIEVL